MAGRTGLPELRNSEMHLVLPYEHPLFRPLLEIINETNAQSHRPLDGVETTMLITFGEYTFTFCWGFVDAQDASEFGESTRACFRFFPSQVSVAESMDYTIVNNALYADAREKNLRQ